MQIQSNPNNRNSRGTYSTNSSYDYIIFKNISTKNYCNTAGYTETRISYVIDHNMLPVRNVSAYKILCIIDTPFYGKSMLVGPENCICFVIVTKVLHFSYLGSRREGFSQR